jgi:hypothetical protein
MVVSRSLPLKSVCTSLTRLKNLSRDVEVAGTVRYCHGLTIRAKSGNSCWCSDKSCWCSETLLSDELVAPTCHEWGRKVTLPDEERKIIVFSPFVFH